MHSIDNYIQGNWQNLLNINRLPTSLVIKPISVAAHSWLVAILVDIMMSDIIDTNESIADKRFINDFYLIKGKVLESALFHDMDEAITGDIPRIPCIYDKAKELKEEAKYSIISLLFNGNPDFVFDEVQKHAKDGIEGSLVAYCDYYSLLIECVREINLGNSTMDKLAGGVLSLMREIVINNGKFDTQNLIFVSIIRYIEKNYVLTEEYFDKNFGIQIIDWGTLGA